MLPSRAGATRRSSPSPGSTAPLSHSLPALDLGPALRAGSAGLTVFVLGMFAAPLVAALAPTAATAWPWIIGTATFLTAGIRVGRAALAASYGAFAAVVALLLGSPVLLLMPRSPLTLQTWFAFLGLAVAVGAGAAWFARRTTRSEVGEHA